MALASRQPTAVFLFGPTAVGKTHLIESLDPDRNEIISADSMQVYRRLDIGTAKPERAVLDRIPHHLIDIVDPREQFGVGEFVRLANEAISDVWGRGKLPVVSGGAGFYLKHLLYGLPTAPASTPEVRARVQERLERDGLASLYEELRRIDSRTAGRLAPADEYRITRALEVYETSGRPLSDFPLPSEPRTDISVVLIGLERPRPELHERIERRVDAMFAYGLRPEVEALVADGYNPGDPGLRGIGYQEFFDDAGALKPPSHDAAIAADICTGTRRYCKRQATFFRSLPDVTWIPAVDSAEALRYLSDLQVR